MPCKTPTLNFDTAHNAAQLNSDAWEVGDPFLKKEWFDIKALPFARAVSARVTGGALVKPWGTTPGSEHVPLPQLREDLGPAPQRTHSRWLYRAIHR